MRYRLLALITLPCALAAQQTPAAHTAHAATTTPAVAADSVPIYTDLGTYSRRISTRSAMAQRYFDQGMRLTYGFGKPEAVRAFRAAIRADSACAMCWWGLAWALGPYINGPTIDSATAVEAHAAAQRAVALRAGATPVEGALIDAMAARFSATPPRGSRAPLDSAYANAMRDVVRRFPADLDAASLFGESLMLLRPRVVGYWTRAGDPTPGTDELMRTFEGVLKRDPRHPGACHHYIHATEASSQPGRAAACADLLGAVIPGASHIPHMPSHTYMRIGRYADAVRANQQARLADQRAAFGGAPGIYVAHNAFMLASAAAMDGQSAVAILAAADLARESPGATYYHRAILVRFGRWQEVLALPPAGAPPFLAAIDAFARGMAHLAVGAPDSARAYQATLDALLAGVADSLRFRAHAQKSLLGIARGILAGEREAREGRYDAAVSALRAALALEDSLTYDEPEPWPLPVRHVLGAVLLEANRAAEAEAVYREDLRVHPGNGWALAGLEQALRAQSKPTDAVAKEKEKVWERADVILTGSRVRPGK